MQFCVALCIRTASQGANFDSLSVMSRVQVGATVLCGPASCRLRNLDYMGRREIEAGERSNLIIAVGDLALRYPNLLEPWTSHIYAPLSDPDIGTTQHCGAVFNGTSSGHRGQFQHLFRTMTRVESADVIANTAMLFMCT